MAKITLFTGILGSGKTYKMVAEVDRVKDQYFVVHNIEGIKQEYLGDYGVNWIEYCQKGNIDIKEFFSKEYQTDFAKQVFEKYKRPCLVIIDEAQEWFDRHVRTFKMWLSYVRHLDQEIFIVAHSRMNIPAVYRSYIGVEYRAKSSSFVSLPMYFFYNRIVNGQRSGYNFEKKSQRIFDLYKSKEINTNVKEKKSMLLPVMVAGIVLCGFLFYYIPQKFLRHSSEKSEAAEIKKSDLNLNAKMIEEKRIDGSFQSKYALVGKMGDDIVVEDRKTGKQYPLSKITNGWKVMISDRDNYCALSTNKGELVEINSIDRYVEKKNNSEKSNLLIGESNQAPES